VLSPLPTTGAGCTPASTGTLTAPTDRAGLARFSGLGEGNWMLRFQGQVTHAGKTARLVPLSIQGLFPYGRTRRGGAFVERVDALSEHAPASLIPNPEPVEPGTGPTTSRYVLLFAAEHGGWIPGVDLAPDDDAPPAPLALVAPVRQVTEVTTLTPEAPQAGGKPASGGFEQQPSNKPGEFTFSSPELEVVSPPDQATAELDGQPGDGRSGSLWRAALLILALGAPILLALARRRARLVSAADLRPGDERGAHGER
jgi:hypothetical protein